MNSSSRGLKNRPPLSVGETADLGKLAIDRVRNAFVTVGQLVEDDRQRASILIACAIDFVGGAASMIEESEGISEDAAMATVVTNMLRGLDLEVEHSSKGTIARFKK